MTSWIVESGRTGRSLAAALATGLIGCLAASRSGPLTNSVAPADSAAAPVHAPQPLSIRETIREVGPRIGCGVFVWATVVRYGDVNVIVPCIDIVEMDGLRFAVGETHELLVDECNQVRAIVWRGRRYPLDGMPAVIAPRSVTTFTMRDDYQTGAISYDAFGWHWPPPGRGNAATARTACAYRR